MKLGVIPARFQVPDLHPAHHLLIGKAIEENDAVVIVLGVTQAGPTDNDPLDFKTRSVMVKAHYPQVDVAPLSDRPSDHTWSRNLDDLIGAYAKENDTVTIYCGRDGFKSHYKGGHKVHQIDAVANYNGTALRKEARIRPRESVDFRAGMIYAVGKKYPTTHMTVDIAVVRDGAVLMGRRPGATHWRFPGGFVGFDDPTFEAAAKRELMEEMGVEVKNLRDLEYVCTHQVDDWRYRGRPDARIVTALYKVDENNTVGDITVDGAELAEFMYLSIGDTENVTDEHKPLMMELYRNIEGYVQGVSRGPVKRKQN